MPKNIIKNNLSRPLKITLISLLLFIILAIGSFCIYFYSYSEKIFPNTYIGDINFGGLNKTKAQEKLDAQINKTNGSDVVFVYQDKSWTIEEKELRISYNSQKSVETLYQIGRGKSTIKNIKERIFSLFRSNQRQANLSYANHEFDSFITKISELNIDEKDASIKLSDGNFIIEKEQIGKKVDLEKLKTDFNKELGCLKDRKLEIDIVTINPKIFENQMQTVKNQAGRLISKKIVLLSDQNNVTISENSIAGWIEVVAEENNTKNASNGFKAYANEESKYSPKIIINPEKIKSYVETISQKIDTDPVDAKLAISDGKAIVASESKNGYKINRDKTTQLILDVLGKRLNIAGVSSDQNSSQDAEVNLPLNVIKPAVASDTIDNLGIKELIGKGTTNFKGSPQNRITNIKIGSGIFNGVLVKPGEVFSTTKTLGSISADKGFLPELVIKEDTTKPEIGGGLCQVSTTIFRAALNAGLPIVERSNHRYRVSYYEPPVGMDATIYDPSPDLKFENNTSGYILVQTYINGTELTFEFYGTKDSRSVEISDPVMYDVTPPDAPIYKEDASIAPGEIKQKEKAHNGSKASFHYKVTRGAETLFEKTFVSSYVPWRAVYLVAPGEIPNGSANQDQSQPT